MIRVIAFFYKCSKKKNVQLPYCLPSEKLPTALNCIIKQLKRKISCPKFEIFGSYEDSLKKQIAFFKLFSWWRWHTSLGTYFWQTSQRKKWSESAYGSSQVDSIMRKLATFCVNPSYPFILTGVDYAGPFLLKIGQTELFECVFKVTLPGRKQNFWKCLPFEYVSELQQSLKLKMDQFLIQFGSLVYCERRERTTRH